MDLREFETSLDSIESFKGYKIRPCLQKNELAGAKKIAWQLRALAALAEVSGLLPDTDVVAHSYL